MNKTSDFRTTLRAFMSQKCRGPSDLERLTGISARTIENWVAGGVRRPREYTDVLNIAQHLPLNAADTTALLVAADYPPLVDLWTDAKQAGDAALLAVLAPWSNELERAVGVASTARRPPIPPHPFPPSSIPPVPRLMIGREEDMRAIKARMAVERATPGSLQVLTAMRGWPGVGKTTLAAALAHDPDLAAAFPDGVLWASLGQQPNIFSELTAWGRTLGVPDIHQARSVEEISARLRGVLRNQRRLLIVDDAWLAEHVEPFVVGGAGCALLVTTRLPEVARQIAPVPADVYLLGVLAHEDALELLRRLAPEAAAADEAGCRALVGDLEGLPLALQVAGRLLDAEASYGFDVAQLLAELRAGAALIAARAPADRADVANETTPTVAALLALSTDHLEPETLEHFAQLGVFAPKPASFDVAAIQEILQIADARPTVRRLVDRGLLEPTEAERFWMHAVLVMHARSFWEEE